MPFAAGAGTIISMITLKSIPVPDPAIASQYLDGEAVLVHPLRGKVKVLNAAGARIWQALDGHNTVAEIADHLCGFFDVPLETAEQDALRFVQNLADREFVTFLDQ